MEKIDKIIKSLDRFPNNSWGLDTCVSITEKQINDLEQKINFIFPKDFRYFLLKYNWISIPWWYINWITKREYDDLENYYIDKWKTMPDDFIPLSPNWFWDFYWFMRWSDKIYFWQHDWWEFNKSPDLDADSFTEWLERIIEEFAEDL